MNRKFMNFTSVSLALLMSVSCFAPYVPTSVYASESESVQVSTETGDTSYKYCDSCICSKCQKNDYFSNGTCTNCQKCTSSKTIVNECSTYAE